MKPHGSLFYNHKDIQCNNVIIPPKWVYDFPIHQQIIWNRGSDLQNSSRYFQPITEYIYWIIKSPKEFYFNKSQCAFRQSIWNINFEINTKHPAPFPESLVGNIILGCSREGDLIYDPFSGSGTVAKMAVKFKRNYIGSEISSEYVKLANNRIKNEIIQPSLF